MEDSSPLLSRSIPANRDGRRLLWPVGMLLALAAPVAALLVLALVRVPQPGAYEALGLAEAERHAALADEALLDLSIELARERVHPTDVEALHRIDPEELAFATRCAPDGDPTPERCTEGDRSMSGARAQALRKEAARAAFALEQLRELGLYQHRAAGLRAKLVGLEGAWRATALGAPGPWVSLGAALLGLVLWAAAYLLLEFGRWVPQPTRVLVSAGEIDVAGARAHLAEIERCVAGGASLVLVLHGDGVVETPALDLEPAVLHELAAEVTAAVHALQAKQLPAGVQDPPRAMRLDERLAERLRGTLSS